MFRTVVFGLLLVGLLGEFANSSSNCYGNCSTCLATDFAACVNDTGVACAQGYYFANNTCQLMSAFNVYSNQLTQISKQEKASGWVITRKENSTIGTFTCNTPKSGQTIQLAGPFGNQTVSKTFKMAFSQVIILNVYLLRIGWQENDSLDILVLKDSVNLTQLKIDWKTASNPTDVNYLKSCEGVNSSSSLVGRQHMLVFKGTSQASINVLFQPSFGSQQARYSFSNLRLLAGCNNFMYSSKNTFCNECQPGYFYNTDKYTCQQCNLNCKTCSSGSEMSCLSCPAYSLPINKTCKFSGSFHIVNDTEVDQGKAANTSSCGGINMLGGPLYGNANTTLTRKFTLPRHSYMKVRLNMVRIGNWPLNCSFAVVVNGIEFFNITDFKEPGISPICLNELGPILCTQMSYQSSYQSQTEQDVVVTFTVKGPLDSATMKYGLKDIKLVYFVCPKQCATCKLDSDASQICITCNSFLTISSSCMECPNGFFKNTVETKTYCHKCHVLCKNCKGEGSKNCTDCFQNFRLVDGYCLAEYTQGFSMFSQDLSKYNWVASNFQSDNPKVTSFNCTSYPVYGLIELAPAKNITIWRSYNLPVHSGLIIMLNVFKLGVWSENSSSISVLLDNQPFVTAIVNNSIGSTLCSSTNKDFIYTFYKYFLGHNRRTANISIVAGGGIAIRELIITMKDCEACLKEQLSYVVEYMPVYTRDGHKTGMNTWLRFNKLLEDPNSIKNDFEVEIQGKPLMITESEFVYDLRLFTPLDFGFVNGSQVIVSSNPDKVLTKPSESNIKRRRLQAISQSLNQLTTTNMISRYDIIGEDNMEPIQQLHSMAYGFTRTILYGSIGFVALGFGVVTEEFSTTLQLIFLHIYITSNEIPASLKLVLEGMSPIQHLNFFSHGAREDIQRKILPPNHRQPSPHVFQQYYKDITFLRGIYPILILNLCYLVYYIFLVLLFCIFKKLSKSQNLFIRWFKQLSERPANFADCLFRWQFVTVVWTAVVQFEHLNSNPSYKSFTNFNGFLTIFMFVCACLYPIFMAFYLYRVKKIVLKESFGYIYEDIFFKRIKKSQDEYDSFIYIIVKFLRLFMYAFFGALLVSQQIAAPVIMMVSTILEFVYVMAKQIYLDRLILVFKSLETIFFVAFEIIYILMWATSNQWPTQDYLNVGFVADAFIVLLMVNSSIRTIYLGYLKVERFRKRNRKVIEGSKPVKGESTRSAHVAQPKTQYFGDTNRSIIPVTRPEEQVQV